MTNATASSPEVRALTAADALMHRRLMSHAFGAGRVVPPPEDDAPPPDLTGKWGLFENGDLRAALTVLPTEVHWGAEQTLAMGGIAGVATWAEARGRGHIDALLRRALQAMRDEGQVISSLYPFSWAFYRRFGWDWVGEKRSVKLPLRELRAADEGRDVVCLPAEDAKDILAPAYTRFAQNYRGVFTADKHNWNGRLRDDDGRTTYVYCYKPTGEYFLWRYDRDGKEGAVREWVARSPEGYRALLSVLHYLATQREIARVTLPNDTPLWSHILHWDMETRIAPVFMGRVVDVAAALRSIPFTFASYRGNVTLQITDPHAPWNEGIWRIEWDAGKREVDLVVGGKVTPDITCDIAAFSQAFWGTPSLTTLQRAGRVIVAKTIPGETAFRSLCSLLPETPVYTLDDF